MKKRILVVEDEPSILDNILYSLDTDGFSAQGCGTGEEALAAFRAAAYDLVILDIGLPDMSGLEVFQRLRLTRNAPVIFLTARAQEVDRIVGLEMGADDYVVKPFSPRELCARARAVLRRCQAMAPAGADGSVATSPARGAFQLDEERVQIRYFGQALPLSSTEFRLLRVLCEHPGRVYSRAQLMDLAWPEPEAAFERTVDAHIKSLRAKLRVVRPQEDPIQTHRGTGYSLKEAG